MSQIEMALTLAAIGLLLFAAGFYCGGRWVWRGMRDKPIEFAKRMTERIVNVREIPGEVRAEWTQLTSRLEALRQQSKGN